MKEIVFLLFFRIFKLIKNYFPRQQQGGRTTFELNSTAIAEFSSSEVDNSVADFTVHPEIKK